MSYGRSMYGPDPFGGGYGGGWTEPGGYTYPGYDDNLDNPWLGIVSQGIGAAQDVARIAVGGYPPQDIYAPIYAPQYPAQPPVIGAQRSMPGPTTGGIQLSTTTLMLIVGGVLLFMLGKRGR